MKLFLLILLLLLSALSSFAAQEEHTVPNSYYKVEDTNNRLSIPGDRKWFVGANYNRDLPSKGDNGFGFRIGHLFDNIYVDITAAQYSAKYGGIEVYQKGVVRDPQPFFEDGSELARIRRADDPGTLYMIGPSVGFMAKLLRSNHWVEMGGFNASFTRYSDDKRELIFNGGTANMSGAIGYRFGPSIVSAGVTWHQGFVQRVNSTKKRASGDERKNYLPIQWWTADMSLALFMF